jgi:hypothetical protein
VISISCQEDLEEALESVPQLKLVVDISSEAARFNMEPDYSMRSSINIANSSQQQNFMDSSSNRNNVSSFFFEEVKQQQPLPI